LLFLNTEVDDGLLTSFSILITKRATSKLLLATEWPLASYGKISKFLFYLQRATHDGVLLTNILGMQLYLFLVFIFSAHLTWNHYSVYSHTYCLCLHCHTIWWLQIVM